MKQLLVNAITSFVTGVFFCLGIILVFNLFDSDQPSRNRVFVDEPEGLILKEHSIIHGEEKFTIKGKVENISTLEWSRVGFRVKIYAGDALITYCIDDIDYVGATSIRNFTISCHEVDGTNLPPNISYKLSINRGTRD